MKQLIEVLIVGLDATQKHAVVVGQGEEGARDPSRRDADAEFASSIVVENLDAFKAQFLDKPLGRPRPEICKR